MGVHNTEHCFRSRLALLVSIIETHLRLFKKCLLFTTELVFLFVGFMFSMGSAVYLDSLGSKFGLLAFLLGFSLICTTLIWFRRKTRKWTLAADATAWLAHRSWRQLHPRRARYLRILQCSLLFFPTSAPLSSCSSFPLHRTCSIPAFTLSRTTVVPLH